MIHVRAIWWSFMAVAVAIVLGFSVPAHAQVPTVGGGPTPASANNYVPPLLNDIGIDEHLDGQLPMDAMFQDDTGKAVRLGDLFDGKRPVLLVLAYHSCPVLCSLVQKAVVDGLKQIPWTIGKEFTVITLSFDPRDTVKVASDKKKELIGSYGRPGAAAGWHFLVGHDDQIHEVTKAVGWKYHYDEAQGQYAHPSAIMLVKPNGKIARYLYGIEYSPNDMRLGLLEASQGKSITTVDKIILYCYHYDPQGRKYSLFAMHVMQLAGAVTLVVFGGFLALLWARDRGKKKKKQKDAPSPAPGAGGDDPITRSA